MKCYLVSNCSVYPASKSLMTIRHCENFIKTVTMRTRVICEYTQYKGPLKPIIVVMFSPTRTQCNIIQLLLIKDICEFTHQNTF